MRGIKNSARTHKLPVCHNMGSLTGTVLTGKTGVMVGELRKKYDLEVHATAVFPLTL